MISLPHIGMPTAISLGVAISMIALAILYREAWMDNLYFGDLWARIVKMPGWKKKTVGIENRASWEATGMPAPEKELAEYYLKYARATDRRTFVNASEWLKLTGQGDKRHMPLFKLLILFCLTMAEAAGSGLLIATAISDGVTQNDLAPYGFTIAIVLAFMLMAATHEAGREQVFASSIMQYMGSSTASERHGNQKISPTDDYRIDDGVDSSLRFANRALSGNHHRAGKGARSFALFFLSVLVIAIFAVRVVDNHDDYVNSLKELPSTSSCDAPAAASSTDPFASAGSSSSTSAIPGFPAGTASPPSVNCNNTTVNNSIDKESFEGQEISKDIKAAILALAYLFVQFVGFRWAMKHSFIGEGDVAYSITQGYPSYDELYRDKLEPVYKLGGIALHRLRQHLMSRVNKYRDNPSHMTIEEYAFRSRYNMDLGDNVTSSELDDILGKKAFIEARTFRKNLIKIDPSVDPYPASLEKYRHLVEVEEYQRELNARATKENAAQTIQPSTVYQQPAPAMAQQKQAQQTSPVQPPVVPINTTGGTSFDVSQYDVIEVEAAEELFHASTVRERMQMLTELSGGDEQLKGRIQTIYAQLKASRNG